MVPLREPDNRPSRKANPAERKADVGLRLDVDYPAYRRLLTAALSQLAKRGYVVPPDEGLDLIHDFFVEAWAGLLERFDPDRANFDTYVFGAFVRFARPRIVRLNRLRDGLLDPTALAAVEVADAASEDAVSILDVTAVGRAARRLDRVDRDLLTAYAGDERPSERTLAGGLKISRYDLRLKLADALGRLAVELGETAALEDRIGSVAEALWRDKRSVKETADVLRLPVAEVQFARSRLFKQLSQAVRGEKAMVDAQPKAAHASGKSLRLGRDLFAAAIGEGASRDDFEALRKHADAVWSFLEDPASEELAARARTRPPEQIAEVYAALAGDEVEIGKDPDFNAFMEASIGDESMIGEAFATAMMPNLPYDLGKFANGVFLGAPLVDPEHHRLLLEEPSVISGGQKAAELAGFGITPSMIIETARGLSDLAMRFCIDNGIERYGDLILDRVGMDARHYSLEHVLPRDAAIEEVRLTTQLPAETAGRLFDWLCRVAGYSPNLFDGFHCALWGDELRLRRTDVVLQDLFKRLQPPPAVIAA